ncbi:PGF-pre-PGF domain-containing protein [Methanoregula sp.]|uniref:PGF-pre-PGF domain-containing protein n=1 Tax=Methanoregula sp. TaxID=2052170 RepID=UPI002C2A6FE4|nr:PGF-pre-PGF domain-containing protein [Methanoregula sp.]HVP96573.1 PGF-pre-PGF domain-containing protein [Methanoregula sp.]
MNGPVLLSARTLFALMLLPLLMGIAGSVTTPLVFDITPDSDVNTTRIFIANISGSGFNSGAHVLLVPVDTRPAHKGNIIDGGITGPFLNGPQAAYLSGDEAFIVSQGSNALEIIDVSDPAHPLHKGSLLNGAGGALLNAPKSVYVSGNYAYVASSGNNALEIVDVSDPAHPTHKGSLTNGTGGALLNAPKSVFVSGNYAYMASSGSNALEIVDISDPANPVHTGSIKNDALLKTPTGIAVSGRYAFVASSGSNALEIVDVSNPAGPVHKGTIKDGGSNPPFLKSPSGVFVYGKYAYVAGSGSNALEIVDISNPSIPVHKGGLINGIGGAWLGSPASVYVSDHYAYVASAGSNALEIVDISNPAVPIHLGTILNGAGGALLNVPSSVSVSNPYAYVVSKSSNALEIVEVGSVISIPATNVVVSSSSMLTCTFNLTNTTAGEYTVLVANPGGAPGALVNGFSLTAPIPPPIVIGIAPMSGVNSTIVRNINLTGAGFNTTVIPLVKLNRTGFAEIVGTNVTVVSSTQLTCSFDLTGQETGSWNIVVINPDGQESVLVNGFSVMSILLPSPPPTTVTIPVTPGAESGASESLRSGRGRSSVATSSGAPAEGNMTFFIVPDKTRDIEYPYTIISVSFVPTRTLGSTDLIVVESAEVTRPPGNGRITAGVVSIEPVALHPSAIRAGTITFAVSDSWLRANDLTPESICLMHLQDTIWSELTTTYQNRSGDDHYFTASTDGFSFFAISTRVPTHPANAMETTTIAEPSRATNTPARVTTTLHPSAIQQANISGTGTFVERPTRGVSVPDASPYDSDIWSVVPAVVTVSGITVTGGLLIRHWWIRRQNPALFRRYD